MFKHVLMEIIAPGKYAEDKAYREKAQKLFDKYGISPTRVFGVGGRQEGLVFVEMGEFEDMQAAQAAYAELSKNEKWQKLQEERINAGTVLPGSDEHFMLFGS